MRREDRLHAALVEVAAAEHVNHAYLICGVCIAKRALAADEKARRTPRR
jgi:hypothetical protein